MPKNGYTLIELLIVLTIMAILSIVVFINYKTFSQDQILNKALGQVQTMLRLAQSNATASLNCGSSSGVSWAVQFLLDKRTLELTCGPTDSVQKSLTLENSEITSIKCSPPDSTCPPQGATFSPPLKISFSTLYGKVTFIKSGESCVDTAQSVMVVLKNLKNNNNKCFTISKGGAIDVK